jgi:branched-chain amino acid transport system ATP-binding protein
MIKVRGLVAGYDSLPVVRDLNLEVREGEIVGFFGPNGSGKTTTLMTVAGLLPRIAGDIEVFGGPVRPAKSYQLVRRGLALVPEGRGIFYQLTVAENLRVHQHRGSTVPMANVHEAFPELERMMSRRAGTLSGGEQQMLAIGCALVADPRILLIDELSLGLAPLVVERLLQAVEHLAREKNIGVLLVEQHVQAALAIADRAYVVAHGRLTFSGTAGELHDNNALLQASYLGGANGSGPVEPVPLE